MNQTPVLAQCPQCRRTFTVIPIVPVSRLEMLCDRCHNEQNIGMDPYEQGLDPFEPVPFKERCWICVGLVLSCAVVAWLVVMLVKAVNKL